MGLTSCTSTPQLLHTYNGKRDGSYHLTAYKAFIQLLHSPVLPFPFEKMFLEKLSDCEDELVSSLSGVDTQELCDKLSSESRAHFTSLDHHSKLKPQLQFDGIPSSVTDKLKQAMADIIEGPTDDSSGES